MTLPVITEAKAVRPWKLPVNAMTMAGVEHRDTAGEVDIALAFDIPDFAVERSFGKDRRGMADTANHGRLPARHQFRIERHCVFPRRKNGHGKRRMQANNQF